MKPDSMACLVSAGVPSQLVDLEPICKLAFTFPSSLTHIWAWAIQYVFGYHLEALIYGCVVPSHSDRALQCCTVSCDLVC